MSLRLKNTMLINKKHVSVLCSNRSKWVSRNLFLFQCYPMWWTLNCQVAIGVRLLYFIRKKVILHRNYREFSWCRHWICKFHDFAFWKIPRHVYIVFGVLDLVTEYYPNENLNVYKTVIFLYKIRICYLYYHFIYLIYNLPLLPACNALRLLLQIMYFFGISNGSQLCWWRSDFSSLGLISWLTKKGRHFLSR